MAASDAPQGDKSRSAEPARRGDSTARTPQANDPVPQHVVLHTPGRFWLRLLCVALGVALLVSLIYNAIAMTAYREYFQTTPVKEKFHSGAERATKKIAIINISGVMIEGEGFVKRQIDQVKEDDDVKAVVLRINSPGGAVTAADYWYHHLTELREENDLPIVVSMGSLAASGGYYVAMATGPQEDVIFAEPTTITGSIGVIIPRYDLSEAMQKLDIKSDSIVSHPRKELGTWTKEMTPEQRAILQTQVDVLFNRFKDIIKENRPMFQNDQDALDQLATGEVFLGTQAEGNGLVDKIGFLEDAIARAAEMAALQENEYRVVEYKGPVGLADLLSGQIQSQTHPFDPRALMEMATPRAYYLYTWLPPIVSARE